MFPTPLEAVADAAGVAELVNIRDLPEDIRVAKPSFLRRILGAYLYRTDTAFVDLSQPRGRKRFIQAHETGHKLIPWHEASYHLDDEGRLFRDTDEKLELEASFAAPMLIFQGTGSTRGRSITRIPSRPRSFSPRSSARRSTPRFASTSNTTRSLWPWRSPAGSLGAMGRCRFSPARNRLPSRSDLGPSWPTSPPSPYERKGERTLSSLWLGPPWEAQVRWRTLALSSISPGVLSLATGRPSSTRGIYLYRPYPGACSGEDAGYASPDNCFMRRRGNHGGAVRFGL